MENASGGSSNRFNWWFLVGPVLGMGLLIWFFMGRSPAPVENPGDGDFNVEAVPDKDEPQTGDTAYVSEFEKQRDAWKKDGGPGLTGFTPEAELKYEPGAKTAAKPGEKKGPSLDELAHQKAFLSKNMGIIERERVKFAMLCKRYYKEQPIVREVNKYFGRQNMPRFMAVYDQALKDKNLYKYGRDALALPEVRTGIKKYLTNPDSLKVGLMMLADVMSTKPSKSLTDETFRFMAADEQVSAYMAKEFWPTVIPRLPSALIGAPIPDSAKGSIADLANSLSGAQVGAPNIGGGKK